MASATGFSFLAVKCPHSSGFNPQNSFSLSWYSFILLNNSVQISLDSSRPLHLTAYWVSSPGCLILPQAQHAPNQPFSTIMIFLSSKYALLPIFCTLINSTLQLSSQNRKSNLNFSLHFWLTSSNWLWSPIILPQYLSPRLHFHYNYLRSFIHSNIYWAPSMCQTPFCITKAWTIQTKNPFPLGTYVLVGEVNKTDK